MKDFSIDLAATLYRDENPFPVDFDAAWKWCGYTRKNNAKRTLLESFEEGVDYQISCSTLKWSKIEGEENRCSLKSSGFGEKQNGGQNRQDIYLSIDCFKAFAMMAKTEKGKQVRKYFLECERLAKEYESYRQIKEAQQAKALPSTFRYFSHVDGGVSRIEPRRQGISYSNNLDGSVSFSWGDR
jgi:phage anti-repressor protein